MPNFETVSIDVAAERTVVNQRQKIIQEYVAYIQQLPEGQAAKLTAGDGETLPMIRRRLGEAARAADKDLVIKRTGDELYFWVQKKPRKRRPGTPRRLRSPI